MLALVRARKMLLVGLVAVTAAGCAVGDAGVTATESNSAGGGLFTNDPAPDPGPERTYEIIPGVVDFGSSKTPRDYDGFLTAVFGDIEAFWTQAYPEAYGDAWVPLEGEVYAAYPSREEPIPGCNMEGVPATYENVLNSGAYYCILGDYMAYDDDFLLPSLVADLGKEAVGVVLAHEFGHAVQARAGNFDEPTILMEQQADCFAGAWTAHVASGASDLVTFDDADVRSGLIAMLNVRDPIDAGGLDNPDAHGTGFDRVGAFQDGFVGGVTRCVPFFEENRLDNLIDIPFDPSDPNAGNLPLVDPDPDPTNGASDIVTLIPAAIEAFWVELTTANGVAFTPPTFSPFAAAGPLPTCASVDPAAFAGNAVYCPDDNVVYWDQDTMAQLAADPLTGDMSVGYLFSNAYGEAVQRAIGSQRTGEQRELTDDCLTGAWVATIVPPTPEDSIIYLSAGDLDEAIVTAIARSDATEDTNVHGSAFQKVDAFRDGVLGGLTVCQQG